MYDIVNDASKFLKLPSDPTLRREGKLQKFLRTLRNKEFFTKEQYDNIYPCGSQPARIYGTPKTHKLKSPTDTLTFRPVVSSIGTYNYNLAKVLTDMLDPVIPTEYCAKDSFSFCKEIQEVGCSNKFMISYDVCSLFTNIPLKGTIDIAVNLIFDKCPDLKIARQELKKYLNLQLLEQIFFLMATIMIRLTELRCALLWVLTYLRVFMKKDG